jgi:hypothetical protein
MPAEVRQTVQPARHAPNCCGSLPQLITRRDIEAFDLSRRHAIINNRRHIESALHYFNKERASWVGLS